MVIFDNFLTKSVQNIRQYALNCIIFKNFLRGPCPRTPIAKRMASQIWKKHCCPPPLPNLGYAPGNYPLSE